MSKNGKSGSDKPIKLVVKTLGPAVRKRSERLKLDGFTCKECEDYHRMKNLSEEELKKRLNLCSRHRSKYSPPKSPEHFWETDFPTTPELIRRGAFNIEERPKRKKQKSDKTDEQKDRHMDRQTDTQKDNK